MKTLVIADHRVFYGIFARSAPASAEPCYLLEKGERTPYPEMVETFRGDPCDPATYGGFDATEEIAVVLYLQSKTDAERAARAIAGVLPRSAFLFYGTQERLPEFEAGEAPAHAVVRSWEDAIGPTIAEDLRTLFTVQRVAAVRAICERATKIGILLQHDPDPDAIASGLCLRNLIGRNRSSAPMLTFGGVTRPENREMLRVLDLSIEKIVPADLDAFDLLACVDVQPPYFGEGVRREVDVVIDHHPELVPFRSRYRDIRASYGATSTILTEYLRGAGMEPNQKQATALLYGVKSDTLFLGREVARADLDAFQYLYARANLNALRRIERPAIPAESLKTFGEALRRLDVESGLAFAYLGAVEREDVIPQLADLLLQVEGAEWSVAAGIAAGSLVASVRNAGYQRAAGAVVKRVFGEVGSAGGHRSMAKIVVPLDRWEAEFGRADERSVRGVFHTLFLAEATRATTSVADGE